MSKHIRRFYHLSDQIKDYQIISAHYLSLDIWDWKCWNIIAKTAFNLVNGLQVFYSVPDKNSIMYKHWQFI